MSDVESGATGNLRKAVPVPQGTHQGGTCGYHRLPEADWPASGQRQCIAGGATQQQQQQQQDVYGDVIITQLLWEFTQLTDEYATQQAAANNWTKPQISQCLQSTPNYPQSLLYYYSAKESETHFTVLQASKQLIRVDLY